MKLSPWVVPVLIIVLIFSGLYGAELFSMPSVSLVFHEPGESDSGTISQVEMIVRGIKCVDTAKLAGTAFAEMAGVYTYTAYASHARVRITFNPSVTTVNKIREALEGPLYDEASGEFLFHLYQVIEIDGKPIDGSGK